MSPRQLQVIAASLTDRDRQALRLVARFRVMSGAQLQALLWPGLSPRVARRGLARLAELGVLEPLARRVGGQRAGSASTTYALGRAGGYLLRSSDRRVRSAYTPGARYLAHALAVGDLYVALMDVSRGGSVQLAEFDPEPGCWRRYPAPFAGQQTLKPDAYLRLVTAEYEFASFIELDLATEALTTIRAKASRYHDYFRSGIEQAARGVFPRVLWIAPDALRADNITETLARLPQEAHQLFATTTAETAASFLTGEVRA